MNSKEIQPISNPQRKISNKELFESRKSRDQKKIPRILQQQREEFYQKLISLDFDLNLVQKILENGIPTPDVNLVIEIMSLTKELPVEFSTEGTQNTQKEEKTIHELSPTKIIKNHHIKRRKFVVSLDKSVLKEIESGSELKEKEESLRVSEMIMDHERNVGAMRCNNLQKSFINLLYF